MNHPVELEIAVIIQQSCLGFIDLINNAIFNFF